MPDLIHLLIVLLILCAIFAVVFWALREISLPPPLRTVIVVIIAIIAILVLLGMVGYIPMGRIGLLTTNMRILA